MNVLHKEIEVKSRINVLTMFSIIVLVTICLFDFFKGFGIYLIPHIFIFAGFLMIIFKRNILNMLIKNHLIFKVILVLWLIISCYEIGKIIGHSIAEMKIFLGNS